MKKVLMLKTVLNLWRTIIFYICMKKSKFKNVFLQDLAMWKNRIDECIKYNDFFAFSYIVINFKEFRNVAFNRLHRNPIKYLLCRIFFKPLDSLYINMPPENIGGGLYIQHGFSTIVAAEKIGENVSINQQVTIGYNGEYAPIIKDNVVICAGSIIIGNVTISNNCIIGAGSVVTKNVSENSIVAGVPAKKIKNKE